MKFDLIDRITKVEPGKSLEGEKALSLAEEYLQDHFPSKPVMPGVFMIETMVQAGAWLVRVSEDFAHSIVILREARGVKYGQFVRPGDRITVSVEMSSMKDGRADIKGRGVVDGKVVVSGRLELEYFNLADRNPAMKPRDAQVLDYLRRRFDMINVCGFKAGKQ